MAELSVKVAKLEERVYQQHSEDIEESKVDLKALNNKMTAVIVIMCLNGGVNALANWTKIMSLFG